MRLTHVVVNVILFFAMRIQCVGSVYTVRVPLEHQSPDKMYVQRSNPMGT